MTRARNLANLANVDTFTVDSSDRVGLGTTDPAFAFDVQKNVNTLAQFIRNTDGDSFLRVNSHGGNIVGLQLGDDGDADKQQIRSDNTNNALIFNTANAERLRINSSGLVGIGTATATYKLDVESNGDYVASFVQTDTSSAKGGIVIDSKQGRGDLGTWNAITINANDNVSYDSRINWFFDSIADGPAIGGRRTSSSGTDLLFYTTTSESLTEKFRITSTGDVGINETSPQGLLDLKKDNATGEGATLAIRNTGSGAGTSVALHLVPNNGGGNDLQRAASIKSRQTNSGNYADLGFFTSNSDTPAERMTINTSGNVGIGTDEPSEKLSVGSAGGYINNNGIGVYKPHSIGLRNGIFVYNDECPNGSSKIRYIFGVRTAGRTLAS